MRKLIRAALAALLAAAGSVVLAPSAAANVDVYITPGYHEVNGRQWLTTCEPYSVTHRCTTRIWATQISYVNGRFVQKDDWYFNNLTYRPSPRSIWEKNPLAAFGKVGPTEYKWRAADGREWRTECDTPVTGRGGCRNWVKADVISRTSSGYTWLRQQWVLNSMVRFGAVQPLPGDDVPPIEDVDLIPIDPNHVPVTIGSMSAYEWEGMLVYMEDPYVEAGVAVMALGDVVPNLTHWQDALYGPSWPNTQTVCGTFVETAEYTCFFISHHYGSVASVGINTSNSNVELVAHTLIATMP